MSDQDTIQVDNIIAAMEVFVAKRVAEAVAETERRCTTQIAQLTNLVFDFSKKIDEFPVPVNGEKGEAGTNGKDADPVDMPAILKTIEDTIAARVAEIPKPENGKDGEPGLHGKDADPVDMSAVETTIAELVGLRLQTIVIPTPKDGINGKDADADAITEVLTERMRKAVAEAVGAIPIPRDGIDAQDGQDGLKGEPGQDGRDALQIDILPTIDKERSYARGTWASFDGGLWRAWRATTPRESAKENEPDGWECMVGGISAISASLDVEARTMTMHIRRSGMTEDIVSPLPMIVFRGVYKVGQQYKAGDTVQYDGSGWIAERDTEAQPGECAEWKLIAKRGRDARPNGQTMNINIDPSGEPVRLR